MPAIDTCGPSLIVCGFRGANGARTLCVTHVRNDFFSLFFWGIQHDIAFFLFFPAGFIRGTFPTPTNGTRRRN
jgi:hypothetical protein